MLNRLNIVFISLVSICSFNVAPLYAGSLAPFTSDGCSAFPDGTLEHRQLWLRCCTAHDYAYWKGGSYQERVQADKALNRCVAEVGEPELGLLMLAGVRIGGTPFFPTTFRWGYGWPYPRNYRALTGDELEQVRRLSTGIIHQGREGNYLFDSIP
ncbi:hypothetical protein [Neptuniibacter pectenicola]|jgi:hypothetical protein|uniref:hypothetical protein n=1 Tax=Neptuniibacter pectenicola TaxID=1806669 RepID=UPI0009ECE5D0|nr:hypothetical protein [Neptuniibacter pectenicola]